ncbi:H-2 class II histocompatibility antigen, A-U alpha chain-like [Channa argus]|uniref:H-2 class II histocompatibility antigen, A-U alpha chain-like n=1 Tax=Channa argus TaxID=215402 RepID=UPI0035227994
MSSQGFRQFQTYPIVMMKFLELVFVLCCVSADVLHEDIHITGCSEDDGADMFGLEGDEIWYTDFANNRDVEAVPDFAGRPIFRGLYEGAVKEQALCKMNLKTMRTALKKIPMLVDLPNSPVVYSRDPVVLEEKNSLICQVTGFYPAPVTIYWTKNGQNMTDRAITNVPMLNKVGTYSQISRLEFLPQQGDIYSCAVKHPKLTKPLTRFWNVDVKEPSTAPLVFCGLGLIVGVLGIATGSFFITKGNRCR